MKYLLFHGRHVLHTAFQEKALSELVRELQAGEGNEQLEVVFAVTSSNHANSRYNPVPFHYRAIGVDRFAQRVLEPLGASWDIVAIPHMPPTDQFVKRVISYVHAELEHEISPENAIVLCSTPPLITQFRELGYDVRTAEFDESAGTFAHKAPPQILTEYAQSLATWETDEVLLSELSPATIALWKTYPAIPQEIVRLWNETLLTEGGDITETRDYGTYTFSMSRSEVIDRKYEDIKEGIVPGVIVDEGCADGALLVRIAQDFTDSDLIGIEITREYMAQAHERQRRGDFGNSFVFFYQRNLSAPVFDANSIDTTICNSTTHEIWSYAGQDEALRGYLAHKYAQLKPGGSLIIRDVIGPEDGEGEILALFNDQNGKAVPPEEVDSIPVEELSTLGRFYRFSKEFFNGRGVKYQEEVRGGKTYIRLSRKDAADFMSKKEYVNNWDSELHEDFTHWSYSRWKEELERVGFTLDESISHDYSNPWIVDNYFKGTAELFREENGALVDEPYPPTNVVLVARK